LILKKALHITFILVAFIAFLSCKKKKTPVDPPDAGNDYYPTALGKYMVYDVDSIVFDEFTYDSTHYKYQVKEKLEEEYTDAQNRPAIKLVRYIKKYDAAVSYSAMPWTIKDVWQANVTKTNVEVVEENIRFIKLIFPVKESGSWNGNLYNTMEEWEYTYAYIDQPEKFNTLNFDKVLKVTQMHFPTLISRKDYLEKYAKGAGLVYREIIDLKYKNVVSNVNLDWSLIPQKSGVVYTQKIVSWGTE
jgi:hypothetical protein